MKRIVLLGLVALISAPAAAADLRVLVTDSAGQPVPNAVVSVADPTGAKPDAGGTYAMAQREKEFSPLVLVVPVGAMVEFPNFDDFRHHVYSFSKGNRFELKLYGREEKRTVTFENPGVAAIGCNIHDTMVGFIAVVETQYAAATGADGSVTLAGVPQEAVAMTVWHPFAKHKGNTVEVDLPADRTAPVTVTLNLPSGAAHGAGH